MNVKTALAAAILAIATLGYLADGPRGAASAEEKKPTKPIPPSSDCLKILGRDGNYLRCGSLETGYTYYKLKSQLHRQ